MKKLSLILLLKALALVALVAFSGIGLGPDEAQYWTWSERLSAGYYSKPPGIAWQIASGTFFLGNTEWGVRLFAQVIGFLFPLILYQTARKADLSDEQAFLAGLIAALTPLGWGASLLAITDGGLILFWSLALLLLMKTSPNYLIIGFVIACGALFKWPIYWFWLLLLPTIFFIPRLYNRQLWLGIAISLLGILPSLFWNTTHNFATFRHVEATMVAKDLPDTGATVLLNGNFWDFLGAQAALFSPILFILLLAAIWKSILHWKELSAQIKTCFLFSIPPLALFLAFAIFKKMQGNWCQFAYPGALILIVWYAGRKWIQRGAALSCALVFLVTMIPGLQKAGVPIPYKANPFKHNVGWNKLTDALKNTGYDPLTEFLFSDKYQTTAILWFYGPNQHPSYFLNLKGVRLNQFSFWPGLKEVAIGKTGYFVVTENEPYLSRQKETLLVETPKELAPYFEKVEFVEAAPLFGNNKQALIWKCINYNGKEPAASNKF